MPLYHFHSYAQDGSVEETLSYDFADPGRSRSAAIASVGKKVSALGDELFDRDMRMEVTNEAGLILFSIMVVVTDMTRPRG